MFGLLNDLEPEASANQLRLEIAFDHIEDLMRLGRKIDDCNCRVVTEIKRCATTLIRRDGVGPINAVLVFGEVGDVSRFPNRDHFASYAGRSPISVSSGDHQRYRLNRAGPETVRTCRRLTVDDGFEWWPYRSISTG